MAVTYEPIASQTLGADAATVTFDNIPGTYTDLVLVCFFLATSTGQDMLIRFNSDTGTNYSYTWIYANGSTVGSSRQSGTTSGRFTWNASGSSTEYSTVVANIQSYANTNVYKTVLDGGARAGNGIDRFVSLWRSTNAITKVDLSMTSGSVKSGSVVSLYGIKAA